MKTSVPVNSQQENANPMSVQSPMNDKLRPNEVQLFGQRFHASVAVFYLGLGLILADAVRPKRVFR